MTAIRPKTLPAAAAPVLVGTSLALREEVFAPLPALLCFLFALFIQIGANLANDYFDFQKGADAPERIGPVRAVAGGLIEPRLMKRGAVLVFSLAFCLGCGLIFYGGWWLLGVGVACIASGMAYTGGPWPFGYYGFGDVFVFLFFGFIAVMVTFYVQSGYFSVDSFLASIAMGGLITNILVVNNFRDCETDAKAGKLTLVVRFGQSFALAQYQVLTLLALLIPILLWRTGYRPIILLPVLVWPWSLLLRKKLRRSKSGPELNKLLSETAQFALLYGMLLSIGIALG